MRAFPSMLISLLVAIVSSSCTADPATVPNEPWPVVTLSVEPASADLTVGTAIQLSAIPRDPTGAIFIGLPTTWTTSNGSIATVGVGGIVNGMAAGSVEIIATVEGKRDTAVITVTSILAPPVQPVTLRLLAEARGFAMGAAVGFPQFYTDAQYRQVLAAQYNSVVVEDAMGFGNMHPEATQYVFTHPDEVVAFAQLHGMALHGTTMLWHLGLPAWLTGGAYTKTQLLAIVKDHITTVVGHFAGKIGSWDVVNEVVDDAGSHSLRSSIWSNTIGPEYIDSAFVWANRADPAAKLYLNDFNAEGINPKADSVLALVTRLKSRGVPIHGVGFQSHFTTTRPPASSVRANLARFANAGFDIRISEMDVQVADAAGGSELDTQASAYRGVLDACLLTPRCVNFTTWGFTDRYSWVPSYFPGFGRALPFDVNYQPKPAYTALIARLEMP